MSKIKSFNKLKDFVDKLKPILYMRENHTKENPSSDSIQIIENLRTEIKKADLEGRAEVHLTWCFGFCAKGPIVKVYPDDIFYTQVKPEDASEIVQSHLVNHKVVERLLFEEPTLDHKKVEKHNDMSFYKKQSRVALRYCGHINPEIFLNI